MSDGIEVRDNPSRGRYEAWLDGKLAGFAAYQVKPGVLTVLHTEVPDEFAGHGVGGRLARGTLDDLRTRGMKVRPQCPFFASWLTKHPDYQDLAVS